MTTTLEDIKLLTDHRVVRGYYLLIVCPFHDDHNPSMTVYPDYFICKSCGTQGRDLGKLAAHLSLYGARPMPKPEPNFLPTWESGEWQGIYELSLKARHHTPGYKKYLQGRKLYGDGLAMGLGFYQGYITIPIKDTNDELIGLVLRAAEGQKQRFLMPAGQPAQLYVPHHGLLLTEPCAFITFGLFDALTVAMLGNAAMSSTAGKDSFDPVWVAGYRKPLYVIPDKGEYSTGVALASTLDWRGRPVELPYPFDTKDPNGWYCSPDGEGLIYALESLRQEAIDGNMGSTQKRREERKQARRSPKAAQAGRQRSVRARGSKA